MLTLTLSDADDTTLRWLSERGYDAGFNELASSCDYSKEGLLDEDPTKNDGVWVRTYQEHDTWTINERSQEEGFLACNGSDTLQAAVLAFLDQIV